MFTNLSVSEFLFALLLTTVFTSVRFSFIDLANTNNSNYVYHVVCVALIPAKIFAKDVTLPDATTAVNACRLLRLLHRIPLVVAVFGVLPLLLLLFFFFYFFPVVLRDLRLLTPLS